MGSTKDTPTVAQLASLIDSSVLVRFGEMQFSCKVLNSKMSYGHVRLQVRPVSGSGSQWIQLDRLAEIPDALKGSTNP
jgi:hypothetical protein